MAKRQDWAGLVYQFDTPSDGVNFGIATHNRVWDSVNLQWVSMTQPTGGGGGGGSVTQGTVPWVTSVNTDTYSALSGSTAAAGNTTLRTPAGGKQMRLFYLALSADAMNTAPVTASVNFGGSPLYTVSLVPGAIFGRNIGAGKYYLAGSIGAALVLNLSAAQTVNWSLEYLDV